MKQISLNNRLTKLVVLMMVLLLSGATVTSASGDPNSILRKWNAIIVKDLNNVGEIEGRTFVGKNYDVNNSHQFGFKLTGNPSSDIVFAVKDNVSTNQQAAIKVFNGSASVGKNVTNNWFQFMNGGTLDENSDWPEDNSPIDDIKDAAEYWSELTANSTAQIPSGQPGPLKFNCAANEGVAIFNVTDTQTFENNKVQQIELIPSAATHTVIINVESVDGNVNWQNGNMVGNFDNQYWRSRVIWNVYTNDDGGNMGTMNCNPNMKGALVAPTASVTGNSNFDGPVVAENLSISSEIHLASNDNGGWNGNAPSENGNSGGGSCDLSGMTTFTQGGWGAKASGNNPGSIRDAHFNDVFPNGMIISGGQYTLTFTSSSAVKEYLPAGGTAKAMTSNLTNPEESKIAGGILGGQVTALTLNVMFDAAGVFGQNEFELGDLVFTSGTFQGMSVNEFLTLAQTALTGGNTQGYSYSQINDAATSINENFDNGTQNKGDLTCPSSVTGSLGDKVWVDADEDGIQDNGEAGVSGVTVKLYDSGNTLLETTATGQSGTYLFDGLDAGDYYVEFVLPAGYEFTTKDQGSNDNIDSDANTTTGKTGIISLPQGDNITSVDAGIVQLKASLGDYVFFDTDKDGIQDGNENGIQGVTVKLYSSSNSLLGTTTTDQNGLYSFTNLEPGTYYVEFTLVSGYAFSPQNSGNNDLIDSDANTTTGKTANVTLAGGDNNISLDAGMYDTRGSLGNFVFVDVDQDGIQDNGEVGLSGVTVELHKCDNTLVSTITTNQNGEYLFSQLTPGDYYVQVLIPAGYLFSPANQGNDDNKDSDVNNGTGKSDCITLGIAENNLSVDAGVYEPKSSIGDQVFVDNNENGIMDQSEPGIVNVPVALYSCNNDLIATTVTDDFGKYLFAGLDPGDYYVKVTKPSGYFFTVQDAGNDDSKDSDVDVITGKTACITLGLNEDNLTVDAGLYQPTSGIGDFVFNDTDKDGIQDNGETGVSGIVVKLYDCSNNLISTTMTNAEGWYRFGNIPSGDYNVKFILPNGYLFSPQDQGNNNSIDSDVNPQTGKTGCFSLAANTIDSTLDAGIYAQPTDVDLAISKTVNNSNPDDGDAVSFTITVTNNGPGNATNVVVTDLLQTGFVFTSASATSGSYDENSGEWNIAALNNGASATLTISAEVDLGVTQAFNLADAQSYNLFLFEDLIQPSSDTEGKIAVGGNAYLASYSVGDKLPNSNGLIDVLIVGGHLEYVSGRVFSGNAVYGVSTNLPKTVVSIDGTLRQDSVIDFSQAETNLKGLSNALSGYNANGTVDFSFGTLNLTGSNPYMNVFEIDGNDLNAAHTFNLSVPNGSVVLVNISGTGIEWSGGLFVNGTAINNVLYNFYEAQDLKIVSIDVLGSILAPYAHLDYPSGVVNGQVIAKSMTGKGQFNNKLFAGNIPVDPNLVNCSELVSSTPSDNNAVNNTACVTVTVGNVNTGGGTGGQTTYEWTLAGGTGLNEIVWTMANDINGDLLAGTIGGKIFRSADDGTTWNRINNDMNVAYLWDIIVDGNGKLYAGTENGIYYSINNGTTWQGPVLNGNDVRALGIDGFGNIYAGTWGNGVYKSTDGTTWTQMNSGLGALAVHALAIDVNSVIYAGTYGGGVYKSVDFGDTWEQTGLSYNYVWALGITSSGHLFAGTYGGGVYSSEDGGSSWYLIGGTPAYVYAVTVDAADNVFVTTWSDGVYMLTANGPVNNGNVKGGGYESTNTLAWMRLGLSESGVSSLLVNPQGSELYAGAEDGSVYRLDLASVTGVEDETETTVEIPTEFELSQNYPNPFNPSTVISFGIKETGSYKLSVYNLLGEEVAVLIDGELNAGYFNVSFNASGLSSGIYIYRLYGADVNITKKMMMLK